MGLVLNGELYRGSCRRGGRGRIPAARGDRSPRRASKRPSRGARRRGERDRVWSRTRDDLGMTPPLTAKKVFDDARARRSEGAVGWWPSRRDRIALAIVAVASVVDPELVILGGGIGSNGDLLLEPVERELRALSPFRPRIEVSALHEEATLYGSVSMALQAAQDQLFARGEVSA